MADGPGAVGGLGAVGALGRLPAVVPAAAPAGGTSFKDELLRRIAEVERLGRDASGAAADLRAGRGGDVAGVADASRKADEAFRLLVAVRDQVLAAIEEVKRTVP